MARARRDIVVSIFLAVCVAAPCGGVHMGGRIREWEARGLDEAAIISTLPAQKPPMGWNSWYALGEENGWERTNEATIMETADALVSTGLAAAGYTTLVVDDSWTSNVRREGAGLEAHELKFAHGMAHTARYIRDRGLQLGLYTTSGNFTCAGERGNVGIHQLASGGHQREDLELWIRDWGVTYIKHCICNTTAEIRQEAFPAMRRAIDAVKGMKRGRGVVYECANYPDEPWRGGSFAGCNIWRVSPDVADSFESWTQVVDRAVDAGVNERAGKHGAAQWGGAWSSFDYLRIRPGGGQSLEEYRAQMSMFAVLAAPLFIGVDVRNMSEDALGIYKNAEVIAVHQDSAAIVGYRLYSDEASKVQVWVRPLAPLEECARGVVKQGVAAGATEDVAGCQPRAAIVVLNKHPTAAHEVLVTMRQLAESSGLESWAAALRKRVVARVLLRDLWKHQEIAHTAMRPPQTLADSEDFGRLSLEVGSHSAFMGVLSLCIADAVFPSLLPGDADEQHRVWGA